MSGRTIRSFRSAMLGAAAAAARHHDHIRARRLRCRRGLQPRAGNTVDAQTSLTGNPGGSPLLKATTLGTAAAVRGVAANGIGTNGISTSGVGQQGLSDSGIGTLGTHGNTTGVSAGSKGRPTQPIRAAPAWSAGKRGGPGLKAIVNAGAPPLR